MRARIHELGQSLARKLAPVYLVHGEEPLQLQEACDQIRAAARAQGCELRETLEVTGETFNWHELLALSASLSLFGERRLLELHIPSGKPGREGSAAISDYLARAGTDADVLLVITGKLEGAASNSRWFKDIDQRGVVVQIWPVSSTDLPRWLQQRAQSRGLQLDDDAVELLAECVEGNLLAAVQELDKLALLADGQHIDREAVLAAVSDSARYDLFSTVDMLLRGDARTGLRMLSGLRAEGNEVLGMLWAFSRDVRCLHDAWLLTRQGRPPAQAVRAAGAWEKRAALLEQALARHRGATVQAMLRSCSLCDRAAKGAAWGSAWDHLNDLALLLATGKPQPLGVASEL